MPSHRSTSASGNSRSPRGAGAANAAAAAPASALRLAGRRPAHVAAIVLGALVVAGLVVEPGGPPGSVEAVDPAPLPELEGGRAAEVAAASRGAAALPAPIDTNAAAIARAGRGATAARPGPGPDAAAASAPRGAASRPAATFGAPGGLAAAAAGAGALEVEPLIELGSVARGESVEHVIRFRNRGDRPVSILAVRTTCGCTAAEPDVDRLAPGEAGRVRVTFTGRSPGAQTQFVRLVTDDPERAVTSVRIRATVTDPRGDDAAAAPAGG